MNDLVVVALSGGVDSAVAALTLLRAGHAVEALHMSNWDDDEDGYCGAAADWQDARAVADELRIVLHRVSFAAEYRERVFREFLDEYRAGRTPNPDVLCNREVKFGSCLDYVRRLGGAWLATGHYARLGRDGGRLRLLRARDRNKDQSYFLQQVPRAALAAALFPLGEWPKDEVREIARRAGLPVHDRADSTRICFIGDRPCTAFLGPTGRTAQPRDAGRRAAGTHAGLCSTRSASAGAWHGGGVRRAPRHPGTRGQGRAQRALSRQGHAIHAPPRSPPARSHGSRPSRRRGSPAACRYAIGRPMCRACSSGRRAAHASGRNGRSAPWRPASTPRSMRVRSASAGP
jgi:tRNA-specific 2-thiouridylase